MPEGQVTWRAKEGDNTMRVARGLYHAFIGAALCSQQKSEA